MGSWIYESGFQERELQISMWESLGSRRHLNLGEIMSENK